MNFVIKGTKTIDEYKTIKAHMEQLALKCGAPENSTIRQYETYGISVEYPTMETLYFDAYGAPVVVATKTGEIYKVVKQ